MESQQIEYKRSFGKEVIVSLAAFANAEGGRGIVGIDDKGKVCGVDVGPETLQRRLGLDFDIIYCYYSRHEQ